MAFDVNEIAATLGFTADDLTLNRAGRISSHQFWESARTALSLTGWTIAAIGIVLIVMLLVKLTGVVRVVSVVASLGNLVFASLFATKMIAGLLFHRVTTAEGKLEFTSGYRSSAVMMIGKYRGIRNRSTQVLTDGQRYRIYFLAYSDAFLSIEPVGPADAQP